MAGGCFFLKLLMRVTNWPEKGHRAASIGAVRQFQPNLDIIWLGTGEAAGRNTTAWGNGIYKSTDGGKTFKYMNFQVSTASSDR